MDESTGKTIEVEGIELTLDIARFDDFEMVEAIADASDEDLDDTAKMRAVVKLFRLTFGDEYSRVKEELRAVHDGVLTTQTMMDFFTAVLEALGAKN